MDYLCVVAQVNASSEIVFLGPQETSRMASPYRHHFCVQHQDRVHSQYDSRCPGEFIHLNKFKNSMLKI